MSKTHNIIKAIGDGDFLEPFSDDEDQNIDLLNDKKPANVINFDNFDE